MSVRVLPGSSPHSHRFRTATAVLVGCAIAAILIAVTVAVSSSSSSRAPGATGEAWSSFAPAQSGALGARDIADYVAPAYRITPLNQLSVVTVVNLESAAAAAAAASAASNGTAATASASPSGLQVAVHPSPTSSAISLLPGNTIGYDLCGIGKNCAIGAGMPSASRLLLLRREALELALYTFHYLPAVQNVVAILPPGHTEQQSTLSKRPPTTTATSKTLNIAVLFVRPELRRLLAVPLNHTLPEAAPPTVSQMATAPEAPLVSALTGQGLFSEQLQQAQDGSNLIVLDPLPPQ
jgi:hypothetical protein